MRLTIILLATILLVACVSLQKPVEVDVRPMTVSDFLENPFGHDESIKSFDSSLPKGTRAQKLIRRSSAQKHHRPDTIYNFQYKKSKISVYKTQFNQEFLLGGSIKNSEIEMANGIRVRMSKEMFIKSFADLPNADSDTITLKHPVNDRTFRFFFDRRGRLSRFAFTGSK